MQTVRIPGSLLGLLLVVLLIGSGCAATVTAIQYKDLDVQTKMSATIFLPPAAAAKKTVWIDVRNTSDKELDLSSLTSMIVAKGYTILSDPDQANYRLQVNVLYVGKADVSALENAVYAGWGGPVAGAAAGALVGVGVSGTGTGALIGAGVGGLVGGAAEVISGSMVKKVTFSMLTDVQVSEKSDKPVQQQQSATVQQGTSTTVKQEVSEESNWRMYRTRVGSSAVKVNLEFEEARPVLTQGLLRSVAGIF